MAGPDHALCRPRGGHSTKIHQLVDGRGLPLVGLLTIGQGDDSPMLAPQLQQMKVGHPVGRPRTRPDQPCGAKAYSSRAIRKHLRARGITAHIPEPEDQKGHRLRRGSAGGRPPNFDPNAYRGRNVVERGYCHTKQWRGLATRYDKHALTYRAAVALNAVIAWTAHLSDMSSYT